MEAREMNFFRKKILILHLLIILGGSLYVLGSMTIWGYAAFFGVMAFFLRGDIKFHEAVSCRKKMTLPVLLMLMTVIPSLFFLAVVADWVLSPILAIFGYAGEGMKGFFAQDPEIFADTRLEAVIFAGFVVPLIEETICRGYIMGEYHYVSGSKMYAIIFSGIIFGAMHGDIIFMMAFSVTGMLMGYTAMEYGIIWSALLHSEINFVFAELLCRRLLMSFDEPLRYPIFLGMSVFFIIASAIIIFVKRREIGEYISENSCEREQVKATLTSPSFILLMIITAIITIMKLRPLE